MQRGTYLEKAVGGDFSTICDANLESIVGVSVVSTTTGCSVRPAVDHAIHRWNVYRVFAGEPLRWRAISRSFAWSQRKSTWSKFIGPPCSLRGHYTRLRTICRVVILGHFAQYQAVVSGGTIALVGRRSWFEQPCQFLDGSVGVFQGS